MCQRGKHLTPTLVLPPGAAVAMPKTDLEGIRVLELRRRGVLQPGDGCGVFLTL
jgi:hypothetical protein